MVSLKFLTEVYELLGEQGYTISFSPAKQKNFLMYCNGNFIGGLFDEALYFVFTDRVNEMLGNPESEYRGYSTTAQHRMLRCPLELGKQALKTIYTEKFEGSRLVYDMTYTSIGASVLEDFYDDNVVFLRFCYENGLLKKSPLDKKSRIIRTVYIKSDLTGRGVKYFYLLLRKFLVFYDNKGKTDLEKMLNRWLGSFQENADSL